MKSAHKTVTVLENTADIHYFHLQQFSTLTAHTHLLQSPEDCF
jgi:hypothetical protein